VYLNTAKFTCTRCDFVTNKSVNYGGAIGSDGSSAVTLTQTVFSGNTVLGNGGAITVFDGSLAIDRGLLVSNSAPPPAGFTATIMCSPCTSFALRNSIIAKSFTSGFAAVYLYGTSSAVIEATTFLNNTLDDPSYAQDGSAIHASDTQVIVRDSILWAPGASPLVGVSGTGAFAFTRTIAGGDPQACPAPICGGGVTTADPRLVQATLTRPAGAFGRPEVYWAPGLGSPAIGGGGDGGGAAVDLLGNPRVSGTGA
jgi:predicted outer membrane repeat protein